jgi:hypothetical protein
MYRTLSFAGPENGTSLEKTSSKLDGEKMEQQMKKVEVEKTNQRKMCSFR